MHRSKSGAGHILGDIAELEAKIHVQQDFYAINSVLHISLKNDDKVQNH